MDAASRMSSTLSASVARRASVSVNVDDVVESLHARPSMTFRSVAPELIAANCPPPFECDPTGEDTVGASMRLGVSSSPVTQSTDWGMATGERGRMFDEDKERWSGWSYVTDCGRR